MGGWFGAAPEQLEELGRQMRDAAARLETLRRDVDGVINLMIWEGADSDAFNEQWLSSLSASIISAESMLNGAANTLMANAQQQLEASGDTSGFYDVLGNVGKWIGVGGATLHLLNGTPVGKFADRYLSKVHWSPAVDDVLSKSPWMKSVDGILAKNRATNELDEVVHGDLSTGALGMTFSVVGTALDGWSFVHGLSTNPSAPETYSEGVQTALGAAGIVAVAVDAVPVVGQVIFAAEIVNGIATTIDPKLDKQIIDGVADGGKAVLHFEEGQARDEIKVTEAAGRVMSSGVHGALSLIHRL